MTTTTAAALDPTRLIIAALAGLVILLLLIIKFKVQAMISILVGAVAIGLIAGMPFADIISSVNEGIGSTLKGIAPACGTGLHVRLHIGDIRRRSDTGSHHGKEIRRQEGCLGFGNHGTCHSHAGILRCRAHYSDSSCLFSCKENQTFLPVLCHPLLAGLAVGHAFIPPTPGPVLVATMLGVDLGWVIMVGIVCGIFAMIVAGPIWGLSAETSTIYRFRNTLPTRRILTNQSFQSSGQSWELF